MPIFLEPENGLFRGPSEFDKRRDKLKVGQLIRCYNYDRMAPQEDYFIVGFDGILYNTKTQEVAEPKKVLAQEDGWSFEGGDIDVLPESDLERFLNEN